MLPTRIIHTTEDIRYILTAYCRIHTWTCSESIYIVLIFLLLVHSAIKDLDLVVAGLGTSLPGNNNM